VAAEAEAAEAEAEAEAAAAAAKLQGRYMTRLCLSNYSHKTTSTC
jgi:hypothetical protein